MRSTDLHIAYGGGVTVEKKAGDLVTIAGPSVVLDQKGSRKRDLVGDYFRKDTDFGPYWKSVVGLYHHGIPVVRNKNAKGFEFAQGLSEYVFPTVKSMFSDDESAIVSEIVLDMRKDYERWVVNQVEKTAHGWSTGAAGVLREEDGWLKRWITAENSITPIPAEPRTSAMPLKSLLIEGIKGASLTEQLDRVHRAFYSDFSGDGWVVEVFEGYIIAEVRGDFYRIDYAEEMEEIRFAAPAAWEQVEKQTEWIPQKSLYHLMAHQMMSADKSSAWGDVLLSTRLTNNLLLSNL